LTRYEARGKKIAVIPLKDNIPTHSVPIITVTIILVNILATLWMRLVLAPDQAALVLQEFGFIPGDLLLSVSGDPGYLPFNVLTIGTSMFLHGGFLHLIGNMLYLWIFGNNIEDVMGHGKFLFFYLLSGIAAAVTQFSVEPASLIPMVGASGAVSGVLGAYLLLFPYARVKTLIFILVFITTVDLPAIVLLTIWFFGQIIFSHTGGVAWFAHIGGFIFGIAMVKVFAAGRRPLRRQRRGSSSE
jgi:membrane associated rhomboid family serine protease